MQCLNSTQHKAAGRVSSSCRSAVPCRQVVLTRSVARRVPVVQAAALSPPTVAETKQKFIQGYRKPVASIYNTVIQELIVQQHFIRYNVNYNYNAVTALGFVSVFEQVMESVAEEERNKIFDAYISALNEDPAQYRRDASNMEKIAGSLSGPDQLVPAADGNDLQKTLARIAEESQANKFYYNKFFAIGLFRLLELTGAKEPSALEKLVKAVGVRPESVNRDLMMYKGVLSKLSAAKELMREFLEREKRKQQEREAEKASKAAAQTADQQTVQA